MNEQLAAGFRRLLAPVWARRDAKRDAHWKALNDMLCTGLTPEGLEAARVYLEGEPIFSREALILVREPSPQTPGHTEGSGR